MKKFIAILLAVVMFGTFIVDCGSTAAQGRAREASAEHLHVSVSEDWWHVPSGFNSKAARENFE